MIEQTHLTIVGDHQHGKTELLLRYAFDDALVGRYVVYQCGSLVTMRDTFYRAEAMTDQFTSISKVYRANGKEEIRFDSGGRIRFVRWTRGFVGADTHILDDVDDMPIPNVPRILRSAIR